MAVLVALLLFALVIAMAFLRACICIRVIVLSIAKKGPRLSKMRASNTSHYVFSWNSETVLLLTIALKSVLTLPLNYR